MPGGAPVATRSRWQHSARRSDSIDRTGPQSLSGPTAPRGGLGRSGRRTAGNGFPDQQFYVERADHRRAVSLPLEHRGVLQGTQTDSATGRLSRAQRQRRALAGVDGPAGVSAVALLRLPQPVGPQLQPAFHAAALGAVAETGTAQPARTLWDSRRRRPLPGHARSGLFARFGMKLWDSRISYHRPNHQILKLIFDLVTRFLRKKPSDRHASDTCGLPLNFKYKRSSLTESLSTLQGSSQQTVDWEGLQ